MIQVVPYEAEHALALDLQMHQQSTARFITLEYAKSLEGEFSYTVLLDGSPIAVGGVAKLWENRGFVWSMVDRRAGPHFMTITRVAKKALELAPYRRIEADTPCGFPQGHRWLRMLGFHVEAERMRAYMPDGADHTLYAKVK